jgi:CRP-like cAMP-binding protein
MSSLFQELQEEYLSKIMSRGKEVSYSAGEQIFAEGDEADYFYFIVSGTVSIFIEKFHTRDVLRLAQSGDWFGEMAMFNGNRRAANAATQTPTSCLTVSRLEFMDLLDAEPDLRNKILTIVNMRNEDLVLKEKLIDADGLCNQDIHIGIKGDPSLRESAMLRERYESIVDKLLPQLVSRFEDLLLNRSAHRIMIGFNNGEIRISTVLDPFCEEFHPAVRLLDESYVDRHFPKIGYGHKAEMIRRIYRTIGEDGFFAGLPDHLHHGYARYFSNWEPVPEGQIKEILSKLSLLRSIPNFYVRNVTVGVLKDAIHMQFNCDGTHIVSARGYERFLNENL